MDGSFQAAALDEVVSRARRGGGYVGNLLSSDLLSVGVYVLPSGGTDGQSPHQEDEVYYAVRGRARFKVAGHDQVVEPGSLLFVRAGVEHRFHDIDEELVLVVFWAPPERSVKPPA